MIWFYCLLGFTLLMYTTYHVALDLEINNPKNRTWSQLKSVSKLLSIQGAIAAMLLLFICRHNPQVLWDMLIAALLIICTKVIIINSILEANSKYRRKKEKGEIP